MLYSNRMLILFDVDNNYHVNRHFISHLDPQDVAFRWAITSIDCFGWWAYVDLGRV